MAYVRRMSDTDNIFVSAADEMAYFRATVDQRPVAPPVDFDTIRDGFGTDVPADPSPPQTVLDELIGGSRPRDHGERRAALLRLRDRRRAGVGHGGGHAGRSRGTRWRSTRSRLPRRSRPSRSPAAGRRSCWAFPRPHPSASSPVRRRRTPSVWPRPAITFSRSTGGTSSRTASRTRHGCGSWSATSGTAPSTGRSGCWGWAPAPPSRCGPTPTARSTSGTWRRSSPGRTARRSSACSSGNVNTGACDDLERSCAVAHDHGAWVHVDGAFGLWAAASPAHRHLTRGIEQADSWGCDVHKWLNVPYDCGLVFVSRPDVHAAATSMTRLLPGRGQGSRRLGFRPRRVPAGARLRGLGRDP